MRTVITINTKGEVLSIERDAAPDIIPTAREIGALFPPFVCYAIIAGCVISALIIAFCMLTGIGL